MTILRNLDGLTRVDSRLRLGPLIVGISIESRKVAREIAALYDHYPKLPQRGLSDFHIVLRAPNTLRKVVRPQIQFFLDGLPPFAPMPEALGATMFESAINWCVYGRIRRYLILHAAVVERDGVAFIFPGYSGSGKSTLCAALVGAGWRLLSDEFCMIRPSDGMAMPHPRPISLKNDGIERVRRYLPNAEFSKSYPGTTKGTLCFMKAPLDAVARGEEPAQPIAILSPKFDLMAKPTIREIEKVEAFMNWIGHSCNYYALCAKGFETMGNLVEKCAHYEFTYSDFDEAIEIVEAVFDQHKGA